jgi:addiction module RelE/StbE family toxin
MKVVFDDEALDDLRLIFAYIAKDNPIVAREVVARIFDLVESLETPELKAIGRPGLDVGTRELISYPYILVYKIHESRGEIVVISIVHGAQDR